jgi:hypothetical protein
MKKLCLVLFVSVSLISCSKVSTSIVDTAKVMDKIEAKKTQPAKEKKFSSTEDMFGTRTLEVLTIPGNNPDTDWNEFESTFASEVAAMIYDGMSNEEWINCGRNLNKMDNDVKIRVASGWALVIVGTAKYLKDLAPLSEEDTVDIIMLIEGAYRNWGFDFCAYDKAIKEAEQAVEGSDLEF